MQMHDTHTTHRPRRPTSRQIGIFPRTLLSLRLSQNHCRLSPLAYLLLCIPPSSFLHTVPSTVHLTLLVQDIISVSTAEEETSQLPTHVRVMPVYHGASYCACHPALGLFLLGAFDSRIVPFVRSKSSEFPPTLTEGPLTLRVAASTIGRVRIIIAPS